MLIEDVTLVKKPDLKVHARFRGGAATTLTLPPLLNAAEQFATKPEVLAEIDALLDNHTNREVISILNERGHRTGMGQPFGKYSLEWVIYNRNLDSRKQRLRKAGFLTRKEMADELNLSYWQIKDMQSKGLFRASTPSPNNRQQFDNSPPIAVALPRRRRPPPHPLREVQYEAHFFNVDVSVCPACGGQMRIIAFITDPSSIHRYLKGEDPPTRRLRSHPPDRLRRTILTSKAPDERQKCHA